MQTTRFAAVAGEQGSCVGTETVGMRSPVGGAVCFFFLLGSMTYHIDIGNSCPNIARAGLCSESFPG